MTDPTPTRCIPMPDRNRVIEAPAEYERWYREPPSVFLAGGITGCPDWQAEAIGLLSPRFVVLNPRRANFPMGDPTAARAQIEWEYMNLRAAGAILFWFPATDVGMVQPIALYELGAHHHDIKPVIVGVEPGYIREADVRIQMELANPHMHVHDTLAATCDDLIERFPSR